MPRSRACPKCCCSFILTLGLTALFLWLSLRPNNPSCSIQNFYVPALNKTLNSHTNTTVTLMVRLDNPNKDMRIYYDDVRLSLFSSLNNTRRLVAKHTIPSFRQGHKKKAKKWVQLQLRDKQAVSRAVLTNETAVFRLGLATEVRFRIVFWKTKRHKIDVGADVEVNDQGTKVKKKGIKMKKSRSPENSCHSPLLGVLFNLLIFVSINL